MASITRSIFTIFLATLISFILTSPPIPAGAETQGFISSDCIRETIAKLKATAGEAQSSRIELGVTQAAKRWCQEDGSPEDFQKFCLEQFVADPVVLREYLKKCENHFETINGNMNKISLELNEPLQLDRGPIEPIDYLFGNLSPHTHLSDDLYKTKIAFAILLNFPLATLEEKNREGQGWSREKWAGVMLAGWFQDRIPASVLQKVQPAYSDAENYISSYNICMHNLVTPDGKTLFPGGLKLITHWGLRDELKAQYNNKDGILRQQMIVKVMERIINQEVPKVVINNPDVQWDPVNNRVFSKGKEIPVQFENNARYRHIQDIFRAALLVDPYTPDHPTLIRRKFETEMCIPEEQVEAHLLAVLTSPEVKKTAKLIEKRLGRKLQPFDIWYNGFRSPNVHTDEELNTIVAKQYPNREAFQKDLPVILGKLGFSPEKCRYISERVVVDPSRGAGHAAGGGSRQDKAHLRTRFEKGGMNYKGYNIAIHEFGHNVEQVFSMCGIDHTLLSGVPNTAFTEAFAFTFQARDLELLGFREDDPNKEDLIALDTLWSTYELAGVSLVTMKLWHWLYEHPQATPEEIKMAVITISKEVWNKYFAPVTGVKDQILLGIYSHMVEIDLYLPNYPIGHIIQFQIHEHLKNKNLGTEMERMCVQGCITPDLWMKGAVGSPISPEPMLKASQKALEHFGVE